MTKYLIMCGFALSFSTAPSWGSAADAHAELEDLLLAPMAPGGGMTPVVHTPQVGLTDEQILALVRQQMPAPERKKGLRQAAQRKHS